MSNEIGLLPAETLEQAIDHLARHQAVGGWQNLSAAVFGLDPEDDAEEAAKRLHRCLDPERREVFHEVYMRRALRLGRRAGCHVLWHWYCTNVGYKVSEPSESKSERVRLMEEDAHLAWRRSVIAERVEQLEKEDAIKHLRQAGGR